MRKKTSVTMGFTIATILTANMSAINFAAAAGNPFYMPQGPAGKIVADEQAITHDAQGPACEKNNFACEEATIQGDAHQALGLERAAAAEAACEVNNFACQDAKIQGEVPVSGH
jgi:hypothetical protein